MRRLAHTLSQDLDREVRAGGNEPDIVKRFTTAVATRSGVYGNARVDLRTKFIHQRPYAFFVIPSQIDGRTRTEMGDILLVVKDLRRNKRRRHRAAIVQAKCAAGNTIQFAKHQHIFQADLWSIVFRFGDYLHELFGWTGRIFQHLTRSTSFITYLILDVYTCYIARACDFQLPPNYRFTGSRSAVPHRRFEDFLFLFLTTSFIGTAIRSDVRDVIEVIYKQNGWTLDAPEEWREYFGHDPGKESREGFAIIEATIRDVN